MNINRLIMISLFLMIPLKAIAQGEEYQAWKKQVLTEIYTASLDENGTMTFAYRTFSPEVRNLMNKRIQESNGFVSKSISDSALWYIRGWLGGFKQGFYYDDLQKEGRPYNRYAPENQALVQEYQSYYRKALDLDESVDAATHLTADMLSTMADDVLVAPDVKERAYRKAIALAQAGKANIPNETYEYTTYQFLLESYSNQKNPDKYLATLNEMIDRFGSNEELESYKIKVEIVIEKRYRKAALEASKVVAK